MRRKEWSLLLLVGVLSLCLGCIEFPEFLTLTNDVSNDFTVSPTSAGTSATVKIQVADVQQKAAEAMRRPSNDAFIALTAPVTELSSRDLLVLHSFWRT
jgi:hypothetical protein